MGRVAAPYGVGGAIKVQPLSADPAALLAFREWWTCPFDGERWTLRRVANSRMHSGMIVGELEDIRTREMAAMLRGASIGIPREQLPPPAPDEYYRADLIGMSVVNRGGHVLGEVAGFVDSGAHPILRIAGGDAEWLIPWVSQYIDRVDVAARRIEVDWAEDF
jgi:16S rRNA processing protein RimM